MCVCVCDSKSGRIEASALGAKESMERLEEGRIRNVEEFRELLTSAIGYVLNCFLFCKNYLNNLC